MMDKSTIFEGWEEKMMEQEWNDYNQAWKGSPRIV